ncbi:hypothetical protein [Brevundimonas sp.]|jgi:hypothetical protein
MIEAAKREEFVRRFSVPPEDETQANLSEQVPTAKSPGRMPVTRESG